MPDSNKPPRNKKSHHSRTEDVATNVASNNSAAKPRLKCPADASEVKYIPDAADINKLKKISE